MTIVGKIIYGAGKVIGNTAGYGIEATGNVISSIADISGKEKLALNAKKYSKVASGLTLKTSKITAAVAAVIADITIEATIKTAKYIAENAVETNVRIYGESEKFYDKDKYIEVEYKVMEK
ncbi:MAG: hypothetical protein ACREVX_13890 [Clostridium sp.]|uniref:hypothetical protein n=1 Tax=Clostridium sp. TaxID=1506 RepID=UPI003D6D7A43